MFTDPELAWCGLTEAEAAKQGREVTVTRFPWAASGRAITLDRTDGMTKLVIDPKTERILGVGIVGPGAGELISEGVLAIEMGANAEDLKMTIHPHPTLSETLMESAEVFFGQSTHVYKPKTEITGSGSRFRVPGSGFWFRDSGVRHRNAHADQEPGILNPGTGTWNPGTLNLEPGTSHPPLLPSPSETRPPASSASTARYSCSASMGDTTRSR